MCRRSGTENGLNTITVFKLVLSAEKNTNGKIIERVLSLIHISDEESKALNAKILELQAKLADVTIKKDNIVQLQNGKAGNVYICLLYTSRCV